MAYSPEEIWKWADEYKSELDREPTPHGLHHWVRSRYGKAPRHTRIEWALNLRRMAEETDPGDEDGPEMIGPTPETPDVDEDVVYRAVLAAQAGLRRRQDLRDRARITFPDDKPVALVFISDIHFGARGTDYTAAFADAEIIANTNGMYGIFHGDGIDNFIPNKLAQARRGAPITLDEEWALFKIWLEKLGGKLIVAVAGNHDNWTRLLGGVDFLKGILPKRVLYDRDELFVRVTLGGFEWKLLIRHKTRFNSVYNPLHGIKQTVRFHRHDPDIAVAGHVHRGAVHEVWYHQGARRLAILTGTYKTEDEYARQEGFTSGGGRGNTVSVILMPDGSSVALDDLSMAARMLKLLREEC